MKSNTAVKAAPSGRWTLRDKAPRSAPYLQRWARLKTVYLERGSHWKVRHFLGFLLARGDFVGVVAEINSVVRSGFSEKRVSS